MRGISITALAGIATVWGFEWPDTGTDLHVSHQTVLSLGVPVAIISGEVPLSHQVTGTLTHELDASPQLGVGVGVAYQQARFDSDGLGWHWELGIRSDLWRGAITQDTIGSVSNEADADVRIHTTLATLALGLTRRSSGDDIEMIPRAHQLDLAPVFGYGLAQVQIQPGKPSNHGWMWFAGLRARWTTAWTRHLRIGGQVEGSWSEMSMTWSNTNTATFQTLGGSAALIFMIEH